MSSAPPPSDDRAREPGERPADDIDAARREGARLVSGFGWATALRAMARIVDVMIVGLAAGGVLRFLVDVPADSAIVGIVLNTSLLAYFVAGEMRFGTSIGKRMFRLRVREAGSEDTPGFGSALLRNAVAVAVVAGGVVGLLLAVALGVSILMGRGRGFHDRVAGVVVEQQPR